MLNYGSLRRTKPGVIDRLKPNAAMAWSFVARISYQRFHPIYISPMHDIVTMVLLNNNFATLLNPGPEHMCITVAPNAIPVFWLKSRGGNGNLLRMAVIHRLFTMLMQPPSLPWNRTISPGVA